MMPQKKLKAQAIMSADKILIDGVANKWKLAGSPSDTVKQVCLLLKENL